METLLDKLSHLFRELFFYVIPGLIVICYGWFILKHEHIDRDVHMVQTYCSVIILIFAYIIGHLIGLFAQKILSMEDEDFLKQEIEVFKDFQEHHKHFVERYNSLFYFRRNLAVAFFTLIPCHFYFSAMGITRNWANGCISFYFLFLGGILYHGAKDAKEKFKNRLSTIKSLSNPILYESKHP